MHHCYSLAAVLFVQLVVQCFEPGLRHIVVAAMPMCYVIRS